MEIDDTLLHTFIYDENFGFMSDPYPRTPDHILYYGDKRIPIRVYMRDYWQEFMEYLRKNKDKYEPILYTSGVPAYTQLLLGIVDPNREVFEKHLYQNACYIFEKKDEQIFYMLKDISRFTDKQGAASATGRDIKRAILLDPNPLNFMLAPDNGLPFLGFNAELSTGYGDKEEYLNAI
jgi:TFIIF-interacting CTD phosphatase-like protein